MKRKGNKILNVSTLFHSVFGMTGTVRAGDPVLFFSLHLLMVFSTGFHQMLAKVQKLKIILQNNLKYVKYFLKFIRTLQGLMQDQYADYS